MKFSKLLKYSLILGSSVLCIASNLSFASGMTVDLKNHSNESYIINTEPYGMERIGGTIEPGYREIKRGANETITYAYNGTVTTGLVRVKLNNNQIVTITCPALGKCHATREIRVPDNYIIEVNDSSDRVYITKVK